MSADPGFHACKVVGLDAYGLTIQSTRPIPQEPR